MRYAFVTNDIKITAVTKVFMKGLGHLPTLKIWVLDSLCFDMFISACTQLQFIMGLFRLCNLALKYLKF